MCGYELAFHVGNMSEIVEFGAEIWYLSFLAKYANGPELFSGTAPPIEVAYLVIRAKR